MSKTRKKLLRKYGFILLFGALSLAYLELGDWMFGYGVGNLLFISDYLLYSFAEKMAAAVLVLGLLLSDLRQWIRDAQPERLEEL